MNIKKIIEEREKEAKLAVKQNWQKFLSENIKWAKAYGNHHYFRTRYSSKFFIHWFQESNRQTIKEVLEGVEKEIEQYKKELNIENHFRGCNPYCHDSGQDQTFSKIQHQLQEVINEV